MRLGQEMRGAGSLFLGRFGSLDGFRLRHALVVGSVGAALGAVGGAGGLVPPDGWSGRVHGCRVCLGKRRVMRRCSG